MPLEEMPPRVCTEKGFHIVAMRIYEKGIRIECAVYDTGDSYFVGQNGKGKLGDGICYSRRSGINAG